MSTTVEQVIQAAMALATNAGTGATVYRARTAAFGIEELPAIVVKPKQDDAAAMATAVSRIEFILEFELHLRGASPDAAADAVVEKIHLAFAADPTLGGLIGRSQYLSRQWEFDDADGVALKLTLSYLITYAVPIGRL